MYPRALVKRENIKVILQFTVSELFFYFYSSFIWLWLYFKTIWSFFRLWAILDDIETYNNLPKFIL